MHPFWISIFRLLIIATIQAASSANASEQYILDNPDLVPSVLLFLQFTYYDPKVIESGVGGELFLNLQEPIDWSSLCPVFSRILPCIRIRQCIPDSEEYDYDFLDVINVTKIIPFNHDYVLFQSGHLIQSESCSRATHWRTTLWKEDQWMVRTERLDPPAMDNTLQVRLLHPSGFHHQLRLIGKTSFDHGVALYLPKEVYVDKYELQNLYRHNQLPFYATTTPYSDVEMIAEESHPQVLFLYGNVSFPVNCTLPIHMRYAYPSDKVHFHQAHIHPFLFTKETIISGDGLNSTRWIRHPSPGITLSIPIGNTHHKQFVTCVTNALLLLSAVVLAFEFFPFCFNKHVQ